MFPECCPYSKILSTFVSVEQSTDIMKVFSHCPFKKMWKFSMGKGCNGQHSFLFRLCGHGCLSAYDTSYLFKCGVLNNVCFPKVLPQPSYGRPDRLHTFFFINPSKGAWTGKIKKYE